VAPPLPIEAPQKIGRKGELQNVEDHQQEQREEFGPAISALLPIHAWGLNNTIFFGYGNDIGFAFWGTFWGWKIGKVMDWMEICMEKHFGNGWIFPMGALDFREWTGWNFMLLGNQASTSWCQ